MATILFSWSSVRVVLWMENW